MSLNNRTRLSWGHINVNVSELEVSIAFYEKLGFSLLMPAIPYLGLGMDSPATPLLAEEGQALGLDALTTGRACIMQLGDGYPKLDLTEFSTHDPRRPLSNSDIGIVRLCLASADLEKDYADLSDSGVRFISSPTSCRGGLARIAVCVDPDETLIELIEVDREKWIARMADGG